MIPLKIIIRYPPTGVPQCYVKWTTLEEWQVSRSDLVQLRANADHAIRELDNSQKRY